ncbi:hypothetical protein ABEI05_05375 [Erwinia billingiae]|uniref:Putative phage protein n=1 Tax=Erwinia billingiae (strain Eb661) TaxID=634500 RepID=D8MV47_ERWBE|nr:hypothetical protein [Erwinia billingiae]CAX60704.1 Putative phage protein [Erwinia billingiae Eb661]
MPQLGYTLGRDVAVDINTPTGKLRIPKIMTFDAKPQVSNQKITPLNGVSDELQIPIGWNGTITAERMDGTLDDFWAQWEENYFNGIDQQRGTITESITESNGTLSVYRYEGVSFHLTDAGNKQGEKTVSQTLAFTANRRKKVN